MNTQKRDDLCSALKNLGYKKDEARKRADQALAQLGEHASLEHLIKAALQAHKQAAQAAVAEAIKTPAPTSPARVAAEPPEPVYSSKSVHVERPGAWMFAPPPTYPVKAVVEVPQRRAVTQAAKVRPQVQERAPEEAPSDAPSVEAQIEAEVQRRLEKRLHKMRRAERREEREEQREQGDGESKFPWVFALCVLAALKYFGCL